MSRRLLRRTATPRWRPWFHENALLRVDGRDDDLTSDGAGCAPGEWEVPARFGRGSCFDVGAVLSPDAGEALEFVPNGVELRVV